MTGNRSLPHLTHAFPFGDGGELRLTVQQPGDPVEVTFGAATVLLPPGLSIAFGNALAGAGKSSYQSKRAIERRSEPARNHDPGLRIEGDVGAVIDLSGQDTMSGEYPSARDAIVKRFSPPPDTAADDDAVAFREHRLASAASDAEGC